MFPTALTWRVDSRQSQYLDFGNIVQPSDCGAVTPGSLAGHRCEPYLCSSVLSPCEFEVARLVCMCDSAGRVTPPLIIHSDACAPPSCSPCIAWIVARADQRLNVLAISAVGVQSSIMAMDRCCCSARLPAPVLPEGILQHVCSSVHIP